MLPYHYVYFLLLGFCLYDLVSYMEKHNQNNAENNKDGINDSIILKYFRLYCFDCQDISWNCGFEGPTNNQQIIGLRRRQIRNFMVSLMVARGIEVCRPIIAQ